MGMGAFNHRVSMEFCVVIGPLIYIYTLCSLLEAKVLVVRLKATKILSRLLACVCLWSYIYYFFDKNEENLEYFFLVFCFARQET